MQHDCNIRRNIFDVRAVIESRPNCPYFATARNKLRLLVVLCELSVSAECGRTAISRFDADSGAVVSFRIARVSAGELGAERSHFSQGGGESCTLTSLANTWNGFCNVCAGFGRPHK
jgi:hypothetical protein